jgi:uncharacterized protein (TIGR03435 family)
MKSSVPVCLALILIPYAVAQPIAPGPAFDVAALVPATGAPTERSYAQFVNSRVDVSNISVHQLIAGAYLIRDQDVINVPAWMNTDRYDVIAKAVPNTKESVLRAMVGTLLIERFKLVAHREIRMMPGYALTITKDGPKLQPAKQQTISKCSETEGDPGANTYDCIDTTMDELAFRLPRFARDWVDSRVANLTNLKGGFDFRLVWNSRDITGDPDAPAGFSMLDALRKLGLRLESRKVPLSVIVVDSAVRTPLGN